jgi:hypothetical protein
VLNDKTIPDCYLVRYIHDYSHHLTGCCFFSTIDLVRAYNQIPVHPGDIQKTVITTPFGLFFGLRNAAQAFQRFMDDILRDSASLSRTCMISSFSPGHSMSISNIYGLSSTSFRRTES